MPTILLGRLVTPPHPRRPGRLMDRDGRVNPSHLGAGPGPFLNMVPVAPRVWPGPVSRCAQRG